MAPPGFRVSREIVVLSDSETEDEGHAKQELGDLIAKSAVGPAQNNPHIDGNIAEPRGGIPVIGPETIDLTAIPDIDVPPSDPVGLQGNVPQPDGQASDQNAHSCMITETVCLQMILSVLPDISVEYVLKLIKEKTTDATRTTARCEHLIAELLEGEPYPKETNEKKRKREDDAEHELSSYEKGERDPQVYGYEHDAVELLKDEFPNVPVRHITIVLQEKKTLYKAYGVIEKQVRDYGLIAGPFSKTTKTRNKRGTEFMLIEKGSQLPKELHAAKKKIEFEAAKRRKIQEAEQKEEANLLDARMNNLMGECACCFDDLPLNRMIGCSGDMVHFYCKNCICRQIETQMGQSRCRPKCFGVDDCDGTFLRRQLQGVLSEKTFERLEHMQQMEDLKAAGLDFLSECPFCDFKMECLPVEVDKEFRCQNTKCGETSCRLCQKESHIPLTCDEFKKDGQITLRHIVEEAMSAALIRHCNKCKHPFIKEQGCNKMTCTHCRNLQCYVCSQNVTDYRHFGDGQAGRCPLHENVEERHEQEVKRAADEAMAKVQAENPGFSDADLMVKVSDQVKQAEETRRGRVRAEAHAFPYHMVGDQLHRVPRAGQAGAPRPLVPVQQPPLPRPAPQYVHPRPPVFQAPGLGQPEHPIPYQPIFPVQPMNFYGAIPPQQPYEFQFYHPFLPQCRRCHLNHPPDQRC
ncbi:hypothetical protein COCSADRAFT_39416 [Bipolaris sorokiniana ND90Pr]|uniref:RING-type domain-containing protein n=1 Tax=Cochliobolus sativus (strain ND90Pr / ATCC 201652) TaxID=665912 RepID=M2SH31_COCSN|nr:uncharacterized protein COCSADRAFT_39416 [Bipolaris sorokiniana ND90Pr]EMD61715.1 hypothetical protein COCSADRAFT_39416 [Bipolaris sorokiniana ND90Pr]